MRPVRGGGLKYVDRCRFAGAVGAEKAENFAVVDVEGNALHRVDYAVVRLILLFEIFYFYDWFTHCVPPVR